MLGKLSRRFFAIALTVVAVTSFAAVAAYAFSGDSFKAVDASVEVDGTTDKVATVHFAVKDEQTLVGVSGQWSTSEIGGGDALELTGISSSKLAFSGVNFADVSTGSLLWGDDSFVGATFAANENILSATYSVPADTPAGDYAVSFSVEELFDLNLNDAGGKVYTATITVTRPHVCSVETTFPQEDASCTVDGYMAYYQCSCDKYYSDSSCANEIDVDAWKSGDGKIAASHDYGTLVPQDNGTHTTDTLKDGMQAHYFCDTCDTYFDSNRNATTKEALTIKVDHSFTEELADDAHLVAGTGASCQDAKKYYFDCAGCDAIGTTSWTSTEKGDHSFTEKVADDAHLVAGTGANCQDAKEYYYDCEHCDAIGTTSWTSTEKGDHDFTEQLADDAHLVAGTGANCQDAKEYYFDCAHCDEIGTTSWVSDTMGDHEFDTTEWGFKDKATGHAHKCKFCEEHDAVQPHTPGAPATEDDDQICTTCLMVLEPALGHIHANHLTEVGAKPATCTADGNIKYYECSCGAYFEDDSASTEIEDKGSVVIPAGHDYGELVDEVPAVHEADELKAGMKAHFVCGECGKYFTKDKAETTESELIIPQPSHSFGEDWGYKGEDGHAHVCDCGLMDTVAPHEPNIEAPTDDEDQVCEECGYLLAPALTPVTVEIPVTKAVSKGGAADFSGSETFEFVVEPLNTGIDAGRLTISGNSVVVKNMNGGNTVIKITVPRSLYNEIEGFRITEKAGSAEGWTYSQDAYLVLVSDNGNFYMLEGDEETDETSVESIVFTNTYTMEKAPEPIKPEPNDDDVIAKTGDDAPFAGLFATVVAAGIAVLALRRRIA